MIDRARGEWSERVRRDQRGKPRELYDLSARLDAVLTAQMDAVIVIEEHGQIESVNPAFTSLFGYSEEEVVGKDVRILIPEPWASEHSGHIDRYLRTGERRVIGIGREVEGKRKDGSSFPIHLAVSEMQVSGRRMFCGVARDLSEVHAAREALAHSESTLEAVLETAVDPVIIIDQHGVIRSVNAAFSRVFGHAREEALGRNVSILMPAPFASEHDEYMARYLRTGQRKIIGRGREVVALRKDGTEFPINLAVSEMRATSGERLFTGIVHDISRLKHAENTLREVVSGTATSRDLGIFESLCEHLVRAFDCSYAFVGELAPGRSRISTLAFWAHDKPGENFQYDLSGTPCETVVGQQLRLYQGEVWKRFPEDKVLEELRIRCYLGAPLTSVEGEPLGILAILDDRERPRWLNEQDVLRVFAARASQEVERLRGEKLLRKRVEEQGIVAQLGRRALRSGDLESLLEEAAEMARRSLEATCSEVLELCDVPGQARVRASSGWCADTTGNLVELDADSLAALTLTSDEQIVCNDLATERRFRCDRCTSEGIERVLSVPIPGAERVLGCLTVSSRGPRHFTVADAFFLQSIANVLGEAIESRTQADRLAQAESLARLGELTAIVAHEVKNPLAGIISGVRMILKRLTPDMSFEREVLEEVISTTEDLDHSVKDILTYSRPRNPVQRALPIDLLLEDVIGLARRDPAFEGIELSLKSVDASISCDRDMLKSVFLNIFLNAAHAMRGEGRIDVSVEDDTKYCVVCVRDTGPGISREVLAKVFDPFFTTKGGGTGLGLPIAKRFVELHGGTLSVDAPADGGTRVLVRLAKA